MKHHLAYQIGVPLVVIVALVEAYRRYRRRQLLLMPRGINEARGVTMRGAIKAARPTSVER